MRLQDVGLSLTCCGLLACASGPRAAGEPETYGRRDGRVWVRGPWERIRPSKDVDEVIDQLCPAVMELPRSSMREYGQEYCGAIYSLGDGTYYASHPSPLGPQALIVPEKHRMCTPPRYVEDARGRASILADYHNHPWPNNRMPPEDLQESHQRWFLRIQFDTTCHVMKLIPYVGEDRPGEVYEREGREWKLVAIIKPKDKATGRESPPEESRAP